MTNPTTTQQAAAVDMLTNNVPAPQIAADTNLSLGQVTALAEEHGLTAAHRQQRDTAQIDALRWGETHGNKTTRGLADRTRAGLQRLRDLMDAEQQTAEAESEVTKLKRQLAAAEEKLRAARRGGKPAASPVTALPATAGSSSPGPDDSKAVRQQIREWAGTHGYQVSDRGMIPAHVVTAWRNRDDAPQRQAG